MKYQEYINLGFERTDMDDPVEFKETGYRGFTLEKKISHRVLIITNSGELDKPRLYIRKQNTDYFNIVQINDEIVKDLLSESEESKETNPFKFA